MRHVLRPSGKGQEQHQQQRTNHCLSHQFPDNLRNHHHIRLRAVKLANLNADDIAALVAGLGQINPAIVTLIRFNRFSVAASSCKAKV